MYINVYILHITLIIVKSIELTAENEKINFPLFFPPPQTFRLVSFRQICIRLITHAVSQSLFSKHNSVSLKVFYKVIINLSISHLIHVKIGYPSRLSTHLYRS